MNPPNTLVELLRQQAELQPLAPALIFDYFSKSEVQEITYAELDAKARAIAVWLQQHHAVNERVMLLFPAGIDYVASLFGCFYAGAIAVPAYFPNLSRPELTLPRLETIIQDAQVNFILTTAELAAQKSTIADMSPIFGNKNWLAIEEVNMDRQKQWDAPILSAEDIAFLQYTSGSTGTPKGVMLSHANLLHNLEAIYQSFSHSAQSKGVIWLPPYHDMGLIGGILQPIYGGFPVKLMSPISFLEKPFRWLEAISSFRGTTSGGPDFAYQLCIDRITAEQKAMLDLSSWDLAFTGSEPVRSQTLRKFADAFACCGFRYEAFYPCYGLAESSLIVTGGKKLFAPTIRNVDEEKLQHHLFVEVDDNISSHQMVSCGSVVLDQAIAIVNPLTQVRCNENEIGEIWVSGTSVAKGYWGKVEESKAAFQAQIEGENNKTYLRTGDLGCLIHNELYVTGRYKDLIIIRGRNYYPQDIEATVIASSSHQLRQGCCAAFSMEMNNEEQLIIVAEMARRKVNEEVLNNTIKSIRQAVATQHNLIPFNIILIEPREIPRTSSGKIRRRECKQLLISQQFKILAQLRSEKNVVADKKIKTSNNNPLVVSLINLVAESLKIHIDDVDVNEPLISLGLDSLAAMQLKNTLDDAFHVNLDLSDLLHGLTVLDLAALIVNQQQQKNVLSFLDRVEISKTSSSLLSYQQQAQWFIEQLDPGTPLHTLSFAVRLKGDLNVTILQRTFNEIITRHSVLRTFYIFDDGIPSQSVSDNCVIPFEIIQINEADLPLQLAKMSNWNFDLTVAPLVKVVLFQLNKKESVLFLQVHHIAFDGWSFEIFIKELGAIYQALLNNQSTTLLELPMQYSDFARWQRSEAHKNEIKNHVQYWQEKLSGILPILQLPTDFPRITKNNYLGKVHRFDIDVNLTIQLKELCKQQNVTLFSLLLTVWQLFLSRYSGSKEIIVGTPIANRQHLALQGLIGCFINSLAIRTHISSSLSFIELLRTVFHTLKEAYAHQSVPFEQVVEVLNIERSMNHPPVFQTMVVMRNDYLPTFALENVSLEWLPIDSIMTQFDLSLIITEKNQKIAFEIEYKPTLWKEDTIAIFAESFTTLLQSIGISPQQKVDELAILSPRVLDRMLHQWNDTRVSYLQPRTLPQLFQLQVNKTPDIIAVCEDENTLTYAELDEKSSALAEYLISQSIQRDEIIGIHLTRSIESVIAILGVLKAGSAFLLLDNAQPFERITMMLSDAKVNWIITQANSKYDFSHHVKNVFYLEKNTHLVSDHFSMPNIHPLQLAYVIYTSGSTGQPKGVMLSHYAITNRLLTAQCQHPLSNADSVLHATAYSFDVSVWELFIALLSGARLVLSKPQTRFDLNEIIETLLVNQITMAGFTPSVLRALLNEPEFRKCRHLKHIYCGGEAMPSDLPALFSACLPQTALHNFYGPTEGTIDSLFHTCNPEDSFATIPVGKPLSNVQAYILDEQMNPVPIGVAGELYIGGAGLARGYVGRPDQTAERFIPNCFSDTPGERLYKTGDLARFLMDGRIEFLGREDRQVKIRGFRIELNEIEAVLLSHPAIKEVAILPAKNVFHLDRILTMQYDGKSILHLLDEFDLSSNDPINQENENKYVC